MRRRLIASYLALTVVILAVLEVPLAVNYRERLETQLTADLERDAFALAAFSEDTLEGRAQRDLQQVVDQYTARTEARAVVVDASGAAVADSQRGGGGEDFTNRAEISSALGGQVAVGTRYSDTLGQDLLYVAIPVASGEVYGAVRLSYATTQLQSQVRRYWLTLAGVAAVSLLAAAGVGAVLSRWVTRPVDDLRRAAAAIGAGDLTARAPTEAGPPEVRELTAAFNRTADRLQQLLVAQEAFVADASHQLRSPLTALRLRLENVVEECLGDPGRPAEDDVVVDLRAALAETDRLARLVDGLLAVARADAVAPDPVEAEPLPATGLVVGRADAWREVAHQRDLRVEVGATPPLAVLASAERATQILDNLVANALDATPAGGTVTLSARATGDRIELHVVDEGPGLDPAERTRAFDRFWRSPTSRAGTGDGPAPLGGSGLGLAIARRLARVDGGDLRLDEAVTGGVDAVVVYRAAAPEAQVGPSAPGDPRPAS